ncbi:TMEM175 family protein [Chryseobacterium sp. HR92]|uniref:TMEM175 family protein n=1 Tax=Chryseobacterium sp. HR92 TaxID=3094839 RepID=UPI00388F2A36|nr:TMEM175 family protein [Chryseobacterium sp. HR92]
MTQKQQHTSFSDKHPKQDFQVERLAFFSDAIFAIAITLLIIEFKIPHITKETTFDNAWEQLVELKYNFFALLLSFFLIVTYWMRHHFLFKHIHNYNKQIVIANMIMLLPIIFFPFTTAFFAESVDNKNVVILAFRFFLLNHILAGLAIYILYWLAIVKHKEYSFEMTLVERKKFTSDLLFTTITFSVIFLVTFLTNNVQTVLFVFLVCGISKKIFDTFVKKIIRKA